MELKANFHTHTNLCDGSDPAEAVVKEAIKKGFTHLGFSGHMDPDIHMDFPAYVKLIKDLREKYKNELEILVGVELDTLYDKKLVEGAEYIIGSTHFMDVPSEIPMSVDNNTDMFETLCKNYYGGDYYRMTKAYYETEAKVFDNTGCTFVGHFDLITRFNDQMHYFDESDPRYTMPALEVMEYLVKDKGLPFEINCGAYNRNRKADFYPNRFLLQNLHDFGAEILINADAHQKELLDGGFPDAILAAKACGFDHINILTKEGSDQVYLKPLGI